VDSLVFFKKTQKPFSAAFVSGKLKSSIFLKLRLNLKKTKKSPYMRQMATSENSLVFFKKTQKPFSAAFVSGKLKSSIFLKLRSYFDQKKGKCPYFTKKNDKMLYFKKKCKNMLLKYNV
jgi:hypothetical protein